MRATAREDNGAGGVMVRTSSAVRRKPSREAFSKADVVASGGQIVPGSTSACDPQRTSEESATTLTEGPEMLAFPSLFLWTTNR